MTAIFASLVTHSLLLCILLQYAVDIEPSPKIIPVNLVYLSTTNQPAKRPIHAQLKAAPPPTHFAAAGDIAADLSMDLGAPSSGSGNGKGGLDAFDDEVKHSIEAGKTYPPGLPGEWMDCTIEYQVTVDLTGKLLSYEIYPCGNPFLDAAARAAILMASPYPVPPDFGGTQYTVFGSLIYADH